MPVESHWYDEAETIALLRFIDDWTWYEFASILRAQKPIGAAKPHPVWLIMDFTESDSRLTNAFQMFRQADKRSIENLDTCVIVGNGIIRSIVGAYKQVYREHGRPILVAQSIDEALHLIRERRRSQRSATRS